MSYVRWASVSEVQVHIELKPHLTDSELLVMWMRNAVANIHRIFTATRKKTCIHSTVITGTREEFQLHLRHFNKIGSFGKWLQDECNEGDMLHGKSLFFVISLSEYASSVPQCNWKTITDFSGKLCFVMT